MLIKIVSDNFIFVLYKRQHSLNDILETCRAEFDKQTGAPGVVWSSSFCRIELLTGSCHLTMGQAGCITGAHLV